MISLLSQRGQVQYDKYEYVADKKDELEKIPKKGQGTIVLVIENSTVYILNGSNEWVPLGEVLNKQ